MTAKATTTKTTTKAAAKATVKKAPAAETVPMATCPVCKHRVPVRSYPTEQRVEGKKLVECRKCRDARYAGAKTAREA